MVLPVADSKALERTFSAFPVTSYDNLQAARTC